MDYIFSYRSVNYLSDIISLFMMLLLGIFLWTKSKNKSPVVGRWDNPKVRIFKRIP